MGQRTAARGGRSAKVAKRLDQQIVRDAAGASGCRHVELLPEPPAWRPGDPPRVRPCTREACLALDAPPGLLHEALLPLRVHGRIAAALRFVTEGPPDAHRLRAFRAIARGAAARLEAGALRQETAQHLQAARREKRAVDEVRQAKETLAALSLAGTHLMVETGEEAVFGVICRELSSLGFQSAVLTAPRTPGGPVPPYRFAVSSFSAPLQRATERILGRGLDSIRVDPEAAPLVRRAIDERRATRSDRVRDAARQIFGATDAQIRRLERLLGLRHVLVAPLRYDNGTAALLVVAAQRLRRSDPQAIDAFALQASIALEKARLFAELRAHQASLESEVQRRTRELTLAVKALEELDRRKDNFFANVSHELRTPLVTVLGYTDLLLSEKIGELGRKQRECLSVVGSSARRLRSFIDELLEYSRWELTKAGMSFAPLEVAEVLSQAVGAAAPRFAERGLRLRARVSPSTPPVLADRDRVQQVLMNLVTNAERHCTPGGRVLLAAAPVAGRVELSVTDDGAGIAPEHLERIFDRLYQVGDAGRQRGDGGGLGLGLAIAKSIVEAHGGAISVRSRVGRGTTFRFSLPAAGARELSAPPTEGRSSSTR